MLKTPFNELELCTYPATYSWFWLKACCVSIVAPVCAKQELWKPNERQSIWAGAPIWPTESHNTPQEIWMVYCDWPFIIIIYCSTTLCFTDFVSGFILLYRSLIKIWNVNGLISISCGYIPVIGDSPWRYAFLRTQMSEIWTFFICLEM